MDITRLAIEKNRTATTILLILAFAGIGAYINMPRSEDPGFIVRVAEVQTVFPGASPERVELLVTDKLEKMIQQMPELRVVRSESSTGFSVVYAEIKKDLKEMRPIWDKLRRKVDAARAELPDTVIGPVVNDEFGDVFGIQYALTGDGFDYRQLREVAKQVRNELLLLSDVAKVELYGLQDDRVYVEYNNARLAEMGLSPQWLQQTLTAQNIILPGGDVNLEYERISLEPSGNFMSIEEIRRAVLRLPGSDTIVRLEDLVDVQRGYAEPIVKMRASGEDAIGIAISLRDGGSIIELGRTIDELFERIRQTYPIGIEFEKLLDQDSVVDSKIASFVGNLYQAIAIVAIVMLVFLGLRTGLIVASLIPMTMVLTLFVMSLFNIGLDQMSLASLIIALGMLVDNAIVMAESIMVQMEDGKKAKQAAIDSARELKIPLLTSSLTTAAAFLPIALAQSETGEYTATLFYVVTMTLLASWVMALTLIPMLCVLFMKVKLKSGSETDEFDSALYRGYRGVLTSMVKRPVISVAGVVGVFVLSLQGFNYVESIFFPPNDRPTFTVEIETPVGSPIYRTESIVKALEDHLNEQYRSTGDQPGVLNWAAYIGSGAPKFNLSYNPKAPQRNYAIVVANATDRGVILDTLIPGIETFLADHFPDVKPTVKPLPLGDEAWPPVAIRLSGRDTDNLFAIADQVKKKLRSIEGTKQISDDWGPRAKKVVFEIDTRRAQLAGVTNQDVALSMQTYLTGLETTQFRERDELIPIVMRSTGNERTDFTRLGNLAVYSPQTGESVPLSQVAEPKVYWESAKIKRRNRLRTVSVESLVAPGTTAFEVNQALEPWLREQEESWPFGYTWEFGGEWETSGIAESSIAEKLPIGLLIIVLLLIGQFNSFRRGAIILLTIPLALIGVVLGLLATGQPFGFMSMLGVISLAGIVINNAIVLIDRFKIEMDDNGLPPDLAIIEACQQRLRPILLTTLTTVGGMIPLWLGGGPLWESMAVTIIFGIVFATALTLGVVPLLYTLFFRVSFRGFDYQRRKTTAVEPGQTPTVA
ncbi:MAG: efflux RND transporter permease subunit [Xanthomonadales bacterium]|nr:efflux RND transporter permease subunit [Xanthomonadales bacterium]